MLATAEKVQSLSLDGGDMLLGYSAPRTWEWRNERYRPKDAFELVLALIRDDGSVAWRLSIPQVERRAAHGGASSSLPDAVGLAVAALCEARDCVHPT
ncbi:MAG: hypothetical protein HZA52_09335 [Planctomycetes bacterium]|nr:hypothetical protein [Planctomycetota bacterium]